MKKLMAVLVVLALVFAGCTGFANFTQGAEDKVCNASPEVLAVADMVLNVLKPLIEAAAPGSGVVLAYITASNIKATGCASLKALAQLIDFINGFNTAKSAAGQRALSINPQPLINWRAKAIKK